MRNRNLAFTNLNIQQKELKQILKQNKVLTKTLELLQEMNLPNWYLGGGSVPQIIWNYYHGFDLNFGIKDYDIVYFDPQTINKDDEDKINILIKQKYPDCPVHLELVNEARTHLWYEQEFGKKIKPYICTEDAVYSFPTTASAIGLKLDRNSNLHIFAPHGLTDLLSLVVRANKIQITKKVYEKKSERWSQIWPKLTIIPWDYD